jgi:hypothetical protein
LTFAHRGVRWDSPQTVIHPARMGRSCRLSALRRVA